MAMTLAFGAGFLLPVVMAGPTMIGLVPGRISLKGWRVAVLLCTSARLGFVPDDVASASPVAVARRGERLKVESGALDWMVSRAGLRRGPGNGA